MSEDKATPTIKIPQELENRIAIYLLLKEKGLDLEEIAFLAQSQASFPALLNSITKDA